MQVSWKFQQDDVRALTGIIYGPEEMSDEEIEAKARHALAQHIFFIRTDKPGEVQWFCESQAPNDTISVTEKAKEKENEKSTRDKLAPLVDYFKNGKPGEARWFHENDPAIGTGFIFVSSEATDEEIWDAVKSARQNI